MTDAGRGDVAALFVPDGPPRLIPDADRRVRATLLCRGPWDEATLHGGPVSALLAAGTEARARDLFPSEPDAWLCSRLTVDILAPVPLGPLEVSSTVVKRGRRAAVVDAALWAPAADGARLVARSSSQWVRLSGSGAALPVAERRIPPRGRLADPGCDERFAYPRPGFNVDTCDLEYIVGSHEDAGPGTTWIRFRVPVVSGEPLSAFTRFAAVADLSAAAGWDHSPGGGNYINPDLTVQLTRWPEGEWLAVEAETVHGDGAALLDAAWYDRRGFVGRVTQSLVEAPIVL